MAPGRGEEGEKCILSIFYSILDESSGILCNVCGPSLKQLDMSL